MGALALSAEKRSIINALLAETKLTVDELYHGYEQASLQSQRPMNPARYLSVSQVCEMCGISRFTVSRWLKKNVIKFCKLAKARGGKVLIDADSLQAFLDHHSNVSMD